MKENILKEKAFDFALRIVKLSQYLADEKREFVMSKQVLRSGTSIGANIEEANQAQSKPDFITNFQFLKKNRLKPTTG